MTTKIKTYYNTHLNSYYNTHLNSFIKDDKRFIKDKLLFNIYLSWKTDYMVYFFNRTLHIYPNNIIKISTADLCLSVIIGPVKKKKITLYF